MGTRVSSLCEESVSDIEWNLINSKDLYVELSQNLYSPNKDLCKKVCQNCTKSQILPTLMAKIIEYWNQDYLVSNLLLLLKHFFLFVVSEKIPYNFLFEDPKKPTPSEYENSFHRLVPCNFFFQGYNKTIYISVPQTNEFDRNKEQSYMIDTIKSNFPEVNEHVLRHNEKIYLSDENGKVLGIEDVYKHYSNESKDVLVDPFKPKTKHFTVLKAFIKTMECDLASPISLFLKQLIEKLTENSLKTHLIRTNSALETILSLLSSQLYWLEKPIGRISYNLFKPSPALDILMNLPVETAQMFCRTILEYSCSGWKALPKKSIFSNLLSSALDIRLSEIEFKAPQLGLYLILILNSSGHIPNPFKIQSWEMKWDFISKFTVTQLSTLPGLVLLTELLMRNQSFYNHVLSLSDPEIFLEPLLGELYKSTKITCRVYLILVLLLILSKDKIFIRFINKDVILTNISWLKEYHIEKISLGSLMFLSLTKLFRENIRSGKLDYIHITTVGCLFNISTSVMFLHELPSMEYLLLCKALFSKYSKLLHKNTSELSIFHDLTELSIELLCKIMSSGLSSNPNLVQAVLHHSELFTKLKNSELVNPSITAVFEYIEACMKSIDIDNIQISILQTIKLYQFPALTTDILPCKEFVFLEHPGKWEEFITPYLWTDLVKEIFYVPNNPRIVLFRHN